MSLGACQMIEKGGAMLTRRDRRKIIKKFLEITTLDIKTGLNQTRGLESASLYHILSSGRHFPSYSMIL